MIKAILFPSSYFEPKKVDEDLQYEYDSVIKTGLYSVVLFNYDKWFNEERLVLSERPETEMTAVYRGWMMKPEQYKRFYSELLTRNIRLVTTPEQYALFHLFPNIYPKIEADTAKMLVYPDGTSVDLDEVKKSFDSFLVKDYVKSVKGTPFPSRFTKDITQEEFDKAMEVFFKYRDSLYTGGICIKEFLPLKRYDGKTNEFRCFIADHNILTVSRNSLQPYYTADPPKELIEKYTLLDGSFYTLDIAELENGSWKIIEAGDGQVSGLSPEQDATAFFRSLFHCFQ